MKIWVGYGSEHSANLVIIGKFKSAAEAQSALDLLNEATDIARADEKNGLVVPGKQTEKFSKAQLDFFGRTNLSVGDPEQLLYDFNAVREADRVVITTEEMTINAFINVMIHKGAKIEIYSAHDHGEKYGR